MNVVGAPKETMFKTSGIKSATARLPRSPALDLFCLLQMDALLVPPDALAPKLVHGIRVQAPIHLEQRQLQVGSVRHRRLHLCVCMCVCVYVCMSIYLYIGASTYTRTGAPPTSATVCVRVDISPHRRLPSQRTQETRWQDTRWPDVSPTCALHVHMSILFMLQRMHLCRLSLCVCARAHVSQRNPTRTPPLSSMRLYARHLGCTRTPSNNTID